VSSIKLGSTTRAARLPARATRPRRVVSAAVLLSLVVAAAWPAAGVVAAPSVRLQTGQPVEILSRSPYIRGPADFTICVGQSTKMLVAIEERVMYRSAPGGPVQETTRDIGRTETIAVDIGVPDIVKVNIPFAQTTPGNSSGAVARFTFKGLRPGRSAITFQDIQNREAFDVTIGATVQECYYEVSSTSIWHYPDGFKPSMYSRLPKTEVRLIATAFVWQGKANAQNQATAPSYRGCIPLFKPDPNEVKVEIRPDTTNPQVDNTVLVKLTYASLSAETKVCNVAGVGAHKVDAGTPRTLTLRMQAFTSGAWDLPHVIDADFAIVGETRLRVDTIKVP
jgi:hypothetical protein